MPVIDCIFPSIYKVYFVAKVKTNLNEILIFNADGADQPLADHSGASNNVEVYFRDIKNTLIKKIGAADCVLGCVAWLTDFDILDALAGVDNVSIIVQKEDFLRPDMGAREDWKKQIRKRYAALNCSLYRFDFGDTILSEMSYAGDPSMSGAVRCVGNVNTDKDPAFPRMHNKFLVFCKYKAPHPEGDYGRVIPYAIWTGSYNLSKNAGYSFENGMYITDPVIVNAYYQEWAQITALSEDLDWFADWVAPEWRIGT